MRNLLTVFGVGCALFGGVVAHAQLLPITNVTPSSLSFTPGVGGNYTFIGTVTNNTTDTIESGIPGLALFNLPPTDVTFDTTDFSLAFGLPPLAPGDAYTGTLFTLAIGPAQLDSFDLRFEVEGLDGNGSSVPRATGVYETRVTSSPSQVPEPGSVALLMGGLLTSGVLLVRRRK